jgi:hypothetical protein
LMTPDEAASLLARVQPPPRRIGFACDPSGCQPVGSTELTEIEAPDSPGTGLFRSGEIDLTGDGFPEQVRLEAGQVVISNAGAETWRTPAEWQVVDLALGDPNDDGRAELLLALFKPDAAGIPRSHPFVVGYREGAYRILWGGSAVPDPIREVELGDVDGDGVAELVVLDEQGVDQTVAVWRWHGWGFSLLWRSPAGRYHDLVLLPGQAGSPILTVFPNP